MGWTSASLSNSEPSSGCQNEEPSTSSSFWLQQPRTPTSDRGRLRRPSVAMPINKSDSTGPPLEVAAAMSRRAIDDIESDITMSSPFIEVIGCFESEETGFYSNIRGIPQLNHVPSRKSSELSRYSIDLSARLVKQKLLDADFKNPYFETGPEFTISEQFSDKETCRSAPDVFSDSDSRSTRAEDHAGIVCRDTSSAESVIEAYNGPQQPRSQIYGEDDSGEMNSAVSIDQVDKLESSLDSREEPLRRMCILAPIRSYLAMFRMASALLQNQKPAPAGSSTHLYARFSFGSRTSSGGQLVFHPFVGPLNDIYPEGCIICPQRIDQNAWDKTMAESLAWPRQPAEISGVVTFWQACLSSADLLRGCFNSLNELAEHGHRLGRRHFLQKRMFVDVTHAVGILLNAVGLSWELDHDLNLRQLSGEKRREINENGIKWRYRSVVKNLWCIWEVLQDISANNKVTLEAVALLQRKYNSAFTKLSETAQSAMEDALFIYRRNLTDQTISYIGKVKNQAPKHKEADNLAEAIGMIAYETPSAQRLKRFAAMGYSEFDVRTWVQFRALRHAEKFRRPLEDIIAKAKQVEHQASDPNPGGIMHPIIRRITPRNSRTSLVRNTIRIIN